MRCLCTTLFQKQQFLDLLGSVLTGIVLQTFQMFLIDIGKNQTWSSVRRSSPSPWYWLLLRDRVGLQLLDVQQEHVIRRSKDLSVFVRECHS